MDPGRFRGSLVRVVTALCGAGISYSGWLATFLLTSKLGNPVVETILWLSAPVATALGFAAGVAISERRTKRTRSAFFPIFVWPLIGCAIGAGVVYWFGPMLIVFGMFAAGTASVALREVAKREVTQQGG